MVAAHGQRRSGKESRRSGDPAAQCSGGDGVEAFPVAGCAPLWRSGLGL
jgi:hypothetical protein